MSSSLEQITPQKQAPAHSQPSAKTTQTRKKSINS